MAQLRRYPENLARLDHEIQILREQIRENADLEVIGLAAASIHLDCLCRILTYLNQLDLALGYELFVPNETFEENVARAAAGLRMLGELTTMMLGQVDGYLTCFGGSVAIGVQRLQKWAEADPSLKEFLIEYLAEAVRRAKRSRQRSRSRQTYL